MDLTKIDKEKLIYMGKSEFEAVASRVLEAWETDRRENSIYHYEPVSDEARKVHLSSARTVGVGGGNRCEAAGSRVVTKRGMIPIEKVCAGDFVPGHGPWWRRVVDVYESPKSVPVYEVITKRGFRFVGSAEHLSRVCDARHRDWHNGRDANRKTQRWERLDGLEGTTLEDWKFIAIRGNGGFPESCEIDPNDAYFLGLLVGDGTYNGIGYRRAVMSIHCDEKDPEIPEWICSYLARRGVNAQIQTKNGCTTVRWCNLVFRDWLKSIGLVQAVHKDKMIPETVWLGTREVIASYLRGFADSDGCATTKPSVVFISTSENLARGAHLLLFRLGILSSLRLYPPNVAQKRLLPSWRLEVTGRSLVNYRARVGFLTKRKSDRLPADREESKGRPPHQSWDRIRSVRNVGEEKVYGLSIEGKPEYYSNGFLQHNSSKTTSCLAEMVMCSTGRVPTSLIKPPDGPGKKYDPEYYVDPSQKLRGPINCRVVCESLTTTLHPTILPKLQWWKWIGIDAPGGRRGHWGLIPRDCLIGGDWNKSWSEKLRMLRLLYRDPFQNDRVVGESTWQFNSFDQDATDFASGEFHIIMHDEPPPHAIWRENEARVMSVDGRMFLAMTWPDDPSIAVDWLFDKVYDPATRANKDPNIDWINIFATDNPHVNQEAIAIKAESWTDEERQVRIYGQPIRFSNRIHPLFTDQTNTWCFPCGRTVVPVDNKCSQCSSSTLTQFNHVGEYSPEPGWPTVWLLDPHPRKPHMFAWWQVSPQDDLVQVAEAECEGDPTDVAIMCEKIEGDMGLAVVQRYIDPNMGRSPASTRRGITWQDEFDSAGLRCDLADDSDVGRKRIDEYLRPDANTLKPRIAISYRCPKTIHQMKRYVWDDYRKTLEKSLKQKPKEKNDDFPTLMKYLLNTDPTFRFMQMGGQLIRRMRSPMPSQRVKIPVGSARYARRM